MIHPVCCFSGDSSVHKAPDGEVALTRASKIPRAQICPRTGTACHGGAGLVPVQPGLRIPSTNQIPEPPSSLGTSQPPPPSLSCPSGVGVSRPSSNDWRRLFLKRGRTGVRAAPASRSPCKSCRGACKGLPMAPQGTRMDLFLWPWPGGVSENTVAFLTNHSSRTASPDTPRLHPHVSHCSFVPGEGGAALGVQNIRCFHHVMTPSLSPASRDWTTCSVS